MIVHKHYSKTGGHLCGAVVPRQFRLRAGREEWCKHKKPGENVPDRSEDYLIDGGWCCSNKDEEVTCKSCLKKMAE